MRLEDEWNNIIDTAAIYGNKIVVVDGQCSIAAIRTTRIDTKYNRYPILTRTFIKKCSGYNLLWLCYELFSFSVLSVVIVYSYL